MPKKYSNKPKKVRKPTREELKAAAKARKKPKQAKAPKVKVGSPKQERAKEINFAANKQKTLYVIASTASNAPSNMKSSLDTWLKNIAETDDYVFLTDKDVDGYRCAYNPKLDIKENPSYSAQNMKWFLTDCLWTLGVEPQRLVLCTDTTFINPYRIFNNDYNINSWGREADLLYPSQQRLKELEPLLFPHKIKMYHAEAGLVLDMDLVQDIANQIKSIPNLLDDRWDSMSGHLLHVMGISLQNDDEMHIFPHTMMNRPKERWLTCKSHGYMKSYEKEQLVKVVGR